MSFGGTSATVIGSGPMFLLESAVGAPRERRVSMSLPGREMMMTHWRALLGHDEQKTWPVDHAFADIKKEYRHDCARRAPVDNYFGRNEMIFHRLFFIQAASATSQRSR